MGLADRFRMWRSPEARRRRKVQRRAAWEEARRDAYAERGKAGPRPENSGGYGGVKDEKRGL